MTGGTDAAGALPVNWETVPREQVGPAVTRQVVDGERQTVVRYHYLPGAVFPEHAHPQEQVTVVLSGQLEFTVDGHRRRLGPGGVILIPGGMPHEARVVGEEPVESINTLSPRRGDHPGR